ncbi:MAG: hypothetical protein GY941_15860 [Planctomycetes bacterium]|nr:hypothetical protein [Planctomycetota bacterium]
MYIESITLEAKKEFLKWVTENVKESGKGGGELVNPQAWVNDLLDDLGSDSDIRRYEMSTFDSASGNPEMFDITDEMLIFSSN